MQTVEKSGIEKDYKNYLLNKSTKNIEETTAETYWRLIKNLPDFDLIHESRDDIIRKLLTKVKSKDQENALQSLLKYKWKKAKDKSDAGELDKDIIKIRQKYQTLKGSLRFDQDDLDDNKEKSYETIKEHYIRKHHFVKFLEQVEPRRAKFYLLQYYGGLRFSELKLLTSDHIREPGEMQVGVYGGIRVESERSKSKSSRTVEFLSETPLSVLRTLGEQRGKWVDREGRKWENVFFDDLEQSKLNYQLGKKQNGRLYGKYPDVAGDRRTLHSLRHTRITDLVKNNVSHLIGENWNIEKIQEFAGHEFTKTTNKYTQLSIENPVLLEDYVDENDIDLLSVIESQ